MPDRGSALTWRGALALLLVVLALAACAREPDGYGGTAVVALLTRPTGLSPLSDRDTAGYVTALLFSGLTRIGDHSTPVPDLAESWDVSSDGLTWTFHLRKGVKFHDGASLTPQDVVYSLERYRDPDALPQVSQLFAAVAGVEARGDDAVIITLHQAQGTLPFLLAGEILPAHLLETGAISEEAFSRNPVGTGPFKFEAWADDGISLVANVDYYGGRPNLDSVVFRLFADTGAAWAGLMQGIVDLAPDLRPEDYSVIRDDSRFRVVTYPDVFYYTLLFNLEDPLAKDMLFREAFDLALDRKDIIADTLGGLALEATGPFLPGSWAYDPDVPTPPHDTARAVDLLSALGWRDRNTDGVLDREGHDLEVELLVDEDDPLKVKVAQRIKWQLFLLGIKVNVVFLQAQVLLRDRVFPGKYQAVILPFNAGGDPGTFASLFWHSQQIGRLNVARYQNEEVDRLIERGRVATNQAERQDIFRTIHQVLARERAAIFLFVPQRAVGMSSRLEGTSSYLETLYFSAKDWIIHDPSDRR
jgi:peptide/nickel transport system substrate-binding protein